MAFSKGELRSFTRGQRPLVVILWFAVAAGTAFLVRECYVGAVASGPGGDWSEYYMAAARSITDGHSPYAVDGYVYTPLLAVLLAPLTWLEITTAWKIWTAVSEIALLTAVTAFVLSVRQRSWRAPVLFGACVISCFHFWPTTVLLWIGQVDAIVFALLAIATLSLSIARPAFGGVALGLAILLKTWPGALVIALFTQERRARTASLVATGCTLLLAPILVLLTAGWTGLGDLASTTFGHARQPLVSNSTWSASELLFSDTGLAEPLVTLSALHWASAIALTVWVIALAGTALTSSRRQPIESFWNLTVCLLLLLPVSHFSYAIYALPMLWCWGSRVLVGRDRRDITIAVFAIQVGWWLILSRSWPGNGSDPSISAWQYTVVFFATLVACSASVVGVRFIGSTRDRALR